MRAFVLLGVLFLMFILIASSSLANVDLTPDTPPAVSSAPISNLAVAPEVIQIQETAPTVVVPATVYQNSFPVPVTGTCTDPYTVQAGDTMSGIAQLCNTTAGAIRTANPQITNINLIYVGQQLRIPTASGQQPAPVPVTGDDSGVKQAPLLEVVPVPSNTNPVVPVTGPSPLINAGTGLEVKGNNFPPNTPVNIAIGPQNGTYNVVALGITDANGSVVTTITTPASPDVVTPWVVVVATTGSPMSQAKSQPFYIGPSSQ